MKKRFYRRANRPLTARNGGRHCHQDMCWRYHRPLPSPYRIHPSLWELRCIGPLANSVKVITITGPRLVLISAEIILVQRLACAVLCDLLLDLRFQKPYTVSSLRGGGGQHACACCPPLKRQRRPSPIIGSDNDYWHFAPPKILLRPEFQPLRQAPSRRRDSQRRFETHPLHRPTD